MSKPPAETAIPTPEVSTSPGAKRDLRTFIEEKQPGSDTHFATAIAYFYQFEAPESERKDAINAPRPGRLEESELT